VTEYKEKISLLASLIKEGNNTYVLTGAGISTDSGIPDFRTPGKGLWEKVDPMAVSTVSVLMNDPRTFYEQGFTRFASITEAEPNDGHYALARLEELGYIKGLITQNIDGLHVKAGSQKVWEVHGHLRSGYCLACKKEYPFAELVRQVDIAQIPPTCKDCRGMLRPEIVLFGDPMPEAFFALQRLISRECDFMLVVGSSLVVYPVANLPAMADKLGIINLQPTSYDPQAEIVIHENSGRVLNDLLKILN